MNRLPRKRGRGLAAAALLAACLWPAGAAAQVPGAVRVPNPVELPAVPRRPVQPGGYALTLERATEWLQAANPTLRAAREKLARARAANGGIAEAEREAAEVARRSLLALRTAYFEAVLARLLIYEAEENLGYFDNYINRMQARAEEGVAPESEAAKWRLEKARVLDALAEERLRERLARIRFFSLLGGTNSTMYGDLLIHLAEAPAAPLQPGWEAWVREGADAAAVEAAWAAAETHRQRAVAIRSQQFAQAEYLRGVAASYYNENEAPLIALLDAQRTRWSVRQEYWRALAGYHISLAELDAASGRAAKEETP